jgi:acyl-coenzyme A thioesterase PaaI-like protein
VVVARVALGTHLNGHGGLVHGGILGLVFDDAMGWGCDRVLDKTSNIPVTANLSVDFRRPVPEGTTVRIEVILERWEGRKLFWKARMLRDDNDDKGSGEEEVLYAEATSLYIVLRDQKEPTN